MHKDMKLEIIPHVGVGLVRLGMSREDVKSALGGVFSGEHKRIDYYFSNSLQVEFHKERVDFIGVSFAEDYEALYQGNNVFDLEAYELFMLIAKNEEQDHKYNESEYLFPNQIVTLWDADEQYDRLGSEKRKVWAQMGIGSASYLKAVSKYA